MDKKEILKALGDIAESVYDEIVACFYQEAKVSLDKIKIALASNDAPAIAKLAHMIKGSSGNLRLNEIADLSKQLEDAAKAADMINVQKLLGQLALLIP